MPQFTPPFQYLLSLPPAMARGFPDLENRRPPEWFSVADPAGSKLGSGGGVAHLLDSAWHATGGGDFGGWLRSSKKLLLMAGGQSRRLPAYAAPGKILLPFKALRNIPGQRLDQTLLDVQLPAYEQVLAHAPESSRALVTSGDVLLRFSSKLPPFPEADVLGLGMWVKPDVAKDFGVFFSRRDQPGVLSFFLQKPSPETIHSHAQNYGYLVDTGMWLLSEKAVAVLFARCGWDGEKFAAGVPGFYELYAQMGLSLGNEPTEPDPEISALTASVVALPEAEFHHLGTSRQLIESVSAIENRENTRTQAAWSGRQPHPDQHVQNSNFAIPLRRQANHTLWIENSTVPLTWKIASEHVLTGIPPNDWRLELTRGQCLDVLPVGAQDFALRPYGIDDRFKGPIGDAATLWLGAPAPEWFAARGLTLAQAGIPSGADIQQAAIFPILAPEDLSGDFVQWLLAEQPAPNPAHQALWLRARRESAEALCNVCNLERAYRQRRENLIRVLGSFIKNNRFNSFFKLDLQSTAKTFAPLLAEVPDAPDLDPLDRIHEQTFRAAVLRERGDPNWRLSEIAAFREMNHLIVRGSEIASVAPSRNVLDDQIIWARSPVRLDLAGGWSDTPPYCIEYGGAVLNLAVNLNGQPPIQVFAKLSERPEIVVRSIDLGVEQRLVDYADIDNFDQPESSFALAKAALALAGFLPRFHAHGREGTLADQMRAFGGGIELTLLSAVPKGSGLGTSSILAATVLGALSELCGLGWDKQALFQRTLALEQLLTTGGGWQDQAGGLHRGIKVVETVAGLDQKPLIRWLPEHLFEAGLRTGTILLYYTGITRMAKHILQEIVRSLFLNSRQHLRIIDDIRGHALQAFDALQMGSWDTLAETIGASWELNKRLDSGTNPPAVENILERVREYVAAAKLLGAGGGGYLLLVAKDEQAAQRLRQNLEQNPPNATARFVDFSISQEGMAITRS
jgi:galactokinase/mevalonate kinase-like predicted kinase